MGISESRELAEPHLESYWQDDTQEFQILEYLIALEAYEEQQRKKQEECADAGPPKKKREYVPREALHRKDWRSCQWYRDYVIDELGTYDNPDSRHGKLFRRRFAVDKSHVSGLK